MANPNFTRIFGSIGLNATITDNDYNTGWENIAGSQPPTKSEFNSIDGEQDTKLAYLDKRARDEWDSTIDYVVNDIALGVDGKRYIAIANNTGLEPSANSSYWKLYDIIQGAGSGLDADLLDGIDSTGFAISKSIGNNTDFNAIIKSGMYRIESGNLNGPPNVSFGQLLVIHGDNDTIVQIAADYLSTHIYWRSGNPPEVGGAGTWNNWQEIYHTGRQGPGSGLNADLLDGIDSSGFMQSNSFVGQIVASASSNVASGFLECNGAAISRSSYAALFSVIGTLYGAGDGSTTFNIPDLRGEFIRGFDHGRGVDNGRQLSSFQTATAIRNHISNAVQQENDMIVNLDSGGTLPAFSGWGGNLNYSTGYGDPGLAGSIRPRNIAMMYIIKY